MNQKKNIVVFVEQYIPQAIKSVRDHFDDVRVLLLRDIKNKPKDTRKFNVDILLYVDFTKPLKIAEALLPYQDGLLCITARGENGANKLKEVIPHVPYLRTPTRESLDWATDKYEMRKRMKLFDPKNTPRFTKISENTKQERARVIEKVGFPMVIKPANLQESLLVTICFHAEEFEKALGNVYRKLRREYEKMDRAQLPTIMAEEYMEGDMYSIDSYVNSRGDIYHCPLVRVMTGRNIGREDFYNYKQTSPALLKRETVLKAQKVAETAIHALGLRSVTAHVELMKMDDEWKIIEVGPRVGGFRTLLYELSCDIDHSLNDVLVRIPRKPIIPKKCKGFATAMKWFAEKEGKIVEMKGIKKIETLESFHSINMNKKIGDRATFAKNGGVSIFNLFLYNSDRSKLLADIRRVEQLVKVKVMK
jgi:biotin carboxylase